MGIESPRKRSIENGLVSKEAETQDSRFVPAVNLEPGQWVKYHNVRIANKFSQADGSYKVVLENGDTIPVGRDDGLDILFNPPTDTTSGSDTRP